MGLDYHHEQVASIIATQQSRPGALLPILHDIQDALGSSLLNRSHRSPLR